MRWRKQEERKPRNQDFKAALDINVESSSGTLPCFVFWRAAANSAAIRSAEILSDVDVLQPSDTFNTSRVNSRSAPLNFPFL